jgi:hypothetical protein
MIDIDRSWGVAGTFVHGGTETEIGKYPDPIRSHHVRPFLNGLGFQNKTNKNHQNLACSEDMN